MISKFKFIVEKFNVDKLKWEYVESFFDIYIAQCFVLEQRKKENIKYRILEVVDLYV